jgi:hypothetical protein
MVAKKRVDSIWGTYDNIETFETNSKYKYIAAISTCTVVYVMTCLWCNRLVITNHNIVCARDRHFSMANLDELGPRFEGRQAVAERKHVLQNARGRAKVEHWRGTDEGEMHCKQREYKK